MVRLGREKNIVKFCGETPLSVFMLLKMSLELIVQISSSR